MARRKRDTTPGTFHVYAHCVWAAEALFRDDADRMTFLREFARLHKTVGLRCTGYCLMRSHYHLIVDVDGGVLPKLMHALNFRYACMFNGRYAMKGHVFGARYDSRRIDDDEHLLAVFKYVMRNPVDAGLCLTPQEWPWSSYSASVGLADALSFVDVSHVLEVIPTRAGDATSWLRRYIEES